MFLKKSQKKYAIKGIILIDQQKNHEPFIYLPDKLLKGVMASSDLYRPHKQQHQLVEL